MYVLHLVYGFLYYNYNCSKFWGPRIIVSKWVPDAGGQFWLDSSKYLFPFDFETNTINTYFSAHKNMIRYK